MPARDTRYHRPPAEHHDNTTVVLLLTVLPDPASVWEKAKLAAVISGDYEGAELINVPISGDGEPEDETPGAYPVIRGNGTSSDKYTPFQWPALSELCQLVAKHGLGSTAVANMLQFLTTEEITPFAIKQLAKLMFTTVQYMVFESAWKSGAYKQGLKNLKIPWEDPHYGARVP